MDRLYFRKSQRVSSEQDFSRVLKQGKAARRGPLRLYAAANDLSIPRFGISVSKSCGGAVQRNRLKRLAREAFRANQRQIPAGYDYVLIFSPKKVSAMGKTEKVRPPAQYDHKELEKQILELVQLATVSR